MCEKCEELKVKIDRARRLAKQISDPVSIERIEQLVQNYKQELADTALQHE
jgi:hypothetical protein